jgi:hypothetical protein
MVSDWAWIDGEHRWVFVGYHRKVVQLCACGESCCEFRQIQRSSSERWDGPIWTASTIPRRTARGRGYWQAILPHSSPLSAFGWFSRVLHSMSSITRLDNPKHKPWKSKCSFVVVLSNGEVWLPRCHSPNRKKHTTYRFFQLPEKYFCLARRSGNSNGTQNSLVQSSSQESDDDRFVECLERRSNCIPSAGSQPQWSTLLEPTFRTQSAPVRQ